MSESDDDDLSAAQGAVSRLADYLGGSHPHTGLIPQSIVVPVPGITESTGDVSLMRKVALAFVDQTHRVADPAVKGGYRPANTFERLARAGVSPVMYAQMVQSPEFPRLVNRTAIEFVIIPRLPAIQAALVDKAGKGSEQAARVLFELARLTELPTLDDMRREYAMLDETAWALRIREETEASLRLLDEIAGRPV